jgi:hypothetical protein
MQLKVSPVAVSASRRAEVPGVPEMHALLESPAWTNKAGRAGRAAPCGTETGIVVDDRTGTPLSLLTGTVQAVTAPVPTNRPRATTPVRK